MSVSTLGPTRKCQGFGNLSESTVSKTKWDKKMKNESGLNEKQFTDRVSKKRRRERERKRVNELSRALQNLPTECTPKEF